MVETGKAVRVPGLDQAFHSGYLGGLGSGLVFYCQGVR